MKREEYFRKLRFLLNDLPMEDLEQIEDFYLELFYDGLEQGYSEEEVLNRFDSPDEVAKKIRAEYGGLVVYTAKGKSQEEKQERQEKQGYGPVDMIHTVKVQTENVRIRIRTVEDGPVRVYFKPREGQDIVTCEEKDGVFSFEHKMKGTFHLNWLNLFMEYNAVTLELPSSFAGNLWIQTKNGAIKGSGMMNLAQAEITSTNGKIKLENSKVDQLRIKSSNARIELANMSGSSAAAVAGNGIISAKECRFPEQITLETQNGTVSGKNLISDCITLQTCNGLVSGSIIGNENDYNIECSTINGFCNLNSVQSPTRTKSLNAKTHNGRIQIEFAP